MKHWYDSYVLFADTNNSSINSSNSVACVYLCVSGWSYFIYMLDLNGDQNNFLGGGKRIL